MIGEAGTGLALARRTLGHTRVTLAAQATGIARGLLDRASARTADLPPSTGPSALSDMATRIEATRQLVHVAAAKSEHKAPDAAFFGEAAKCFATDTAKEVALATFELLGAAHDPPELALRHTPAARRA